MGGRSSRAASAFSGLLAFMTILGVPAARADSFVVVADTSLSMKQNDPDGLAVLSTLILADLLELGEDHLVFVPFDRNIASARAKSSAPLLDRATFPDGDSFRDAVIAASTRDGRATYFAPGLAQALEALQGRPGRKVVLLLTDGASLDAAGDENRFRDELLPEARKLGARVFVVGLGAEPANTPTVTRYWASHRQGGYVAAPTAKDLPGAFAQVLQLSTGRRVESIQLGARGKASFDGGPSLLRAVDVVAIGPGTSAMSAIDLVMPAGTHWTGAPGDDVEGVVKGDGQTPATNGYRRLRIPSPLGGTWVIQAKRPTELLLVHRYKLQVKLQLAGGETRVVAGRPTCFEAELRSIAAPGAPPSAVTGPLLTELGLKLHIASADLPEQPVVGREVLADAGSAPADAVAGDGTYGACVPLEAQHVGLQLVARVDLAWKDTPWVQSDPVSLDVVPGVQLRPHPATLSIGGAAGLDTGDRGCATFQIAAPDSKLPQPATALRIELFNGVGGSATPGLPATGALRTATVALDGRPLTASPVVTSFELGTPDHEVCVTAGRRQAGGADTLVVRLTPADLPWSGVGEEGSIRVNVRLATPGFFEAWGLPLAFLAMLMGVALFIARLLRPAALPQGLVASSWEGDPERPFGSVPLTGRRAEIAGFTLRMKNSVVVVTCPSGTERRSSSGAWVAVPSAGEGALVEIGVTYRIGTRFMRFGMEAT